jgi:hypothetical protein
VVYFVKKKMNEGVRSQHLILLQNPLVLKPRKPGKKCLDRPALEKSEFLFGKLKNPPLGAFLAA